VQEHPLMKMMRELEAHESKLRELVAKRHRGPDPSAVLKASVPKSRGARLRAVGDQ
jgi:hypothetical protein